MSDNRETFGSRFAVIMAFAGSAIGLGNIWRFPYMTGEGGGALFVLVFAAATLLLSLPIFYAESVIGRRGGANCLGSMRNLGGGRFWKVFGLLCVFTPMFILSYYSVVGGWSLEYLFKALGGAFASVQPSEAGGMFSQYVQGVAAPIVTFTAFLAFTCLIPASGVKSGIEKFSKISIPALFVIILVLAAYTLTLPGAFAGVEYLLRPDFSKFSVGMVADAVGQSFFSLSLGTGIIITYSSYVDKGENLVVSGVGTALAALVFSLLAGLTILPAVFAAGTEPGAGPGLIFETLPFIFSTMAQDAPVLSVVVSTLFFLTVLVAALTSSVSLVEVGIAYMVEEWGLSRGKATLLCFALTWVVGLLSALSFGLLGDVRILGEPVLDAFDRFSSNILMTVCALLGVVFVGFVMPRDDVISELGSHGKTGVCSRAVYFLIKWLCPALILAILIANFVS